VGELTACPRCGRSGFVPGIDGPSSDAQTLADRDQTVSDQDQTWSDQDQTASDRDSDTSAEDQHASDQDFAAGGDPVLYRRSKSARAHAESTRGAVAVLRDESASARRRTAEERDVAAAERDREAAERDRFAAEYEHDPDADLAEVRIQAARDRANAAADRVRAEADREAAARDREESRRAQAEAEQKVRLAASDEVTGVWTRRSGLVQIAREIERARRTRRALTVAFVDVDNLKGVNDRDGHAAGDRLLRLTAATMRAKLRPYDVVVRYGGDEFLCAMPNISRGAAAERMTVIASALSAAELGRSISFGLAEHRTDDAPEELVARADADLLAAREARDRGA